MKKIVMLFVALALAAPVVASAAGNSPAAGKDLCLLDSTKCTGWGQQLTITEEIANLQAALGKGASVYTAEELKVLHAKLDDDQWLLAKLIAN